MKKVGIVIIVVGILITVFTGISFKTEEDVVEIGEFELTREEEHEVNWAPWVGVIVVAAGAVVMLTAKKK
jgi:drug/metabolite transporter (DMT)-like permease